MSSNLLITARNDNRQSIKRIMRDGVEIEKGVTLTIPYLEENKDQFRNLMDIFTAYPDVFLDIIKPKDSNFELFFQLKLIRKQLQHNS